MPDPVNTPNSNSAAALGGPISAKFDLNSIVPATARPEIKIDVPAMKIEQARDAIRQAVEGGDGLLMKATPEQLKKQIGTEAYDVVVKTLAAKDIKLEDGKPVGAAFQAYGQKVGTEAAVEELQKSGLDKLVQRTIGPAVAAAYLADGAIKGGLPEVLQRAHDVAAFAGLKTEVKVEDKTGPETGSLSMKIAPSAKGVGIDYVAEANGKIVKGGNLESPIQDTFTGQFKAEGNVGFVTNGKVDLSATLPKLSAEIGYEHRDLLAKTGYGVSANVNSLGEYGIKGQAQITQQFGVSASHSFTNDAGRVTTLGASYKNGEWEASLGQSFSPKGSMTTGEVKFTPNGGDTSFGLNAKVGDSAGTSVGVTIGHKF